MCQVCAIAQRLQHVKQLSGLLSTDQFASQVIRPSSEVAESSESSESSELSGDAQPLSLSRILARRSPRA